MFVTMHTPGLFGLVKMSDIEIVQIILISFGYDLSDTKDGPRCWRNGIYILW